MWMCEVRMILSLVRGVSVAQFCAKVTGRKQFKTKKKNLKVVISFFTILVRFRRFWRNSQKIILFLSAFSYDVSNGMFFVSNVCFCFKLLFFVLNYCSLFQIIVLCFKLLFFVFLQKFFGSHFFKFRIHFHRSNFFHF